MEQLDHEKIYIKLVSVEDAEDLFQATSDSIHVLRKFPASLPWSLHTPSLESSIRYCQQCITDAKAGVAFTYIVRLSSSADFVGVIGLHQIQWDIRCVTIGFWANRIFHRQGYMTTALQLISQTLKESFAIKRIEAFVDLENESAKQLCLRTGFKLEEVLEKSAKSPVDGSIRDIAIFVK